MCRIKIVPVIPKGSKPLNSYRGKGSTAPGKNPMKWEKRKLPWLVSFFVKVKFPAMGTTALFVL